MLKRVLLALAVVAALLVIAYPALTAEQPKTASVSAQAPALSPEHAARLAKLRALPAPDPKFTLVAGAIAFKPTSVKKEISCGVFVYPPNPNPAATSQRLFWVNDTGQPFPPGVHIQWQVEGMPAGCCSGTTGPTGVAWQPNPPTPVYFYATGPLFAPPQPWTRPCKAWAILP